MCLIMPSLVVDDVIARSTVQQAAAGEILIKSCISTWKVDGIFIARFVSAC